MLATAASYYIKLWNLNNENDIVSVKEKSSCMPHGSSNVLCMEWTQDSSLIGTAGNDGCLVLCIPETGIFSEVIPTGRLKNSKNDEIHTMKFYNKSNYIVFGGSGKIVKCWDRQHNKFLNNYTSHIKTITSLDVNHSENCVSSVSENGDILINSLETKASIFRNISKNSLNKIIYSKNSNTRVFTIDDHGNLYSYDTINLEIDNEIQISDSLAINDISVSPLNNNILITANENGTITFVDSQNKNIVNTYKATDPLTSVSVRIDGSMLACGTSRGQVLLYDIRMNRQLHKFWAETKAVQALRFQKHMLSSESEEFNKSTSLETLSPTIVNNITTPKKSQSIISTNDSNDITSNLLSAFTTPTNKKSIISRTTSSNFFPSNINPPFDYNFSKNKSQKFYIPIVLSNTYIIII
ncbi:WD40 repeat-like protein [Anaeromyces robustus]|uniref:WD40 repeat-like protein n=1 Tax=Anaeromyces robustus TaxID=1754192 RepID=A0A1Y1UWI3_9FUNG|nr:WD40 repeat-like protein [Anaeromyces robustus]|eukprot:ORX42504.1 WD40 repeat-like protein [Anaeromyces robustus]